ncbi:hypothetical protein CAURIS_10305 [Corynebacterium auris]|nr:hypothetical protein CAURIS_10305 [Corynebacterium auris]
MHDMSHALIRPLRQEAVDRRSAAKVAITTCNPDSN